MTCDNCQVNAITPDFADAVRQPFVSPGNVLGEWEGATLEEIATGYGGPTGESRRRHPLFTRELFLIVSAAISENRTYKAANT